MTLAAFDSVSVALCGSGGSGVMTAANMLLDAAAASGYYALFGRSSGPQIRGGEAAGMLRLSPRQVTSVDDVTDILLAIDWQNVQRFAAELPLAPSSLIVADPAAGDIPEALARSGARVAHLPMKDLAKQVPDGRANMVAVGAMAALVGLPINALADVLGKSLKKKHADALDASLAAARLGAEAAAALGPAKRLAPPCPAAGRWTITGNQAVGLGAVKGGIRFVAAYPITPATEVLEWLSSALPKIGGAFVQAEDELASINMCLGASFGGVPALTATSGPGLALMIEALGLSVASETPVVVVDVQRGGPSTGIPTKSEQADLDIAIHGLHGDAPHLVVAPQSTADCLFTTQWAVHLAETLQAPCLVLSDQALGQARAIIDAPPDTTFAGGRRLAEGGEAYRRYAVTESGVSPMALPGMEGLQYTADGLEHSETGTPSSQAADHAAQLDKRNRKLAEHDYGDPWAVVEGDGEIAVVTWGSCTGAAREAVERARAQGVAARLVALRLLSPALPAAMARALAGVKSVLVVEQSHSGQFHKYLRAEYDLPARVDSLHRPGPLPIRPAEVVARLLALGGAA
ncbi:MAG TPA: 2-oxoacid:acceptor oxidoreductase subunit alpha [Candidatus Omnitrophota bacterium]|nr:2-oxoacid:acceptor oxidoreductase subunit alpha [Candidatus Omnitrophota bacterium]